MKPRLIWVDAVCIDQADSEEKARQVQLLFKIFGQAHRTVVWLADDEAIFNDIKPLLEYVVSMKQKQDPTTANTHDYWPDLVYEHFGADLGENVAAYERLVRCEYWHRKWIIQELVASTDVLIQVGKQNVAWELLGLYLDVVGHHDFKGLILGTMNYGILEVQGAILQLRRMLNAGEQGRQASLIELLMRSEGAKASDSRDQVYSLLNMASDTGALGLRPDYSDAKSFKQLYIETTQAMLRSGDSWNVLYAKGTEGGLQTAELPSWVPDWRATCQGNPIWFSGLSFAQFCAGGPLLMTAKFLHQDRLGMRGTLHRLTDVGPEEYNISAADLQKLTLIGATIESVKRWQATDDFIQLRSPDPIYSLTGEQMTDVLWQTLCAGEARATFDSMQKQYQRFREELQVKFTMCEAEKRGDEDAWEDCYRQLEIMTKSEGYFRIDSNFKLTNRRLAWTACNALALVPGRTLETDVLFIAEGAPAPFALRHVKENEYLLLGGAYVHGYMYGEAWTEERLKDMKEVIII